METYDVVVVGGGVVGISIAWRAAQRGLSVLVADPDPERGAWRVAAGMLAPVTESYFGEERLLALALESARRYPEFTAELGEDVGYERPGMLTVALDAGDRAALARLLDYRAGLDLPVEPLTGRQCRDLEPMLAPGVRGGAYVADDALVDPRRLVPALRRAAERAGARFVAGAVATVDGAPDAVQGVTLADGTAVRAPRVVLAAGSWSASVAGIPDHARPPVRPVKGQLLRLRAPGFLSHVVRGFVAGAEIYLLPRSNGELVVGATVEEQGFDTSVRAGAVYELLREAHALLPGLAELPLVECTAGLRPGSPDNAPIVGETSLPGLVVATGHFRNGVLLAPVTADAVAALLADGAMPAELEPFRPDRFAAVAR